VMTMLCTRSREVMDLVSCLPVLAGGIWACGFASSCRYTLGSLSCLSPEREHGVVVQLVLRSWVHYNEVDVFKRA